MAIRNIQYTIEAPHKPKSTKRKDRLGIGNLLEGPQIPYFVQAKLISHSKQEFGATEETCDDMRMFNSR
ncbi:MAG: hypothetical protein QM501_14905, partial [Gimesia sp.]